MRTLVTLVLFLVLALASDSHSALVAEQIRPENAQQRLISGPDAVGGVGDWYLANDVVEIIVEDPSRSYGTLNHGGTIVDVGLIGREGEDQFNRLFPILNLNQRVFANFDTIRAEVNRSQGWARLVVSSSSGISSLPRGGWLRRLLDLQVPDPEDLKDVHIETEYRVRRSEPFVHIETTIHNTGESDAPLFAYGDVLMRGGHGPRAFTANTLQPATSRGFHHLSFDRGNVSRAGDAMAPFTFLSMPGSRHLPAIAYAFFSPERTSSGVPPFFGVTDDQVSLMTAFLFEPDWNQLSLLRIIRAMFETFPAGARWTYQRRLLVADESSVSATTNVIFPLLGTAEQNTGIQGRVRPATVPHSLHVADATTGAPLTVISPRTSGRATGHFGVVLPPGAYVMSIHAPHRPVETRQIEVVDSNIADVLEQRLPEPAYLKMASTFSGGEPARVIITGEAGSPDPAFEPDLLDFQVDGVRIPGAIETNALFFTGNEDDPQTLNVKPGTYRFTATRGPEFDLASTVIDVRDQGEQALVSPLQPKRVVELPGFLSADFHSHAEASDDTNTSNALRLRSFIADGIQILAATDHNRVPSYEPALESVAGQNRIRLMRGAEITSSAPNTAAPYGIGHTNAWPLRFDPVAHRRGAPPTQNLTLADLYALLRRRFGVEVIQMNHPRIRGTGQAGYLNTLGPQGESYDPDKPISEPPNNHLLVPGSDGQTRAIDFDAIEIMNGPSFANFVRARRDVYSFLRQGFRLTGTGGSDIHHLRGPALPRNYVHYPQGLAGFQPSSFNRAVREGRLFCTTGPLFTRFEVNGGMMGDLVAALDGKVRIGVSVEAAPWIPVEEVRVLVNGEVIQRFDDLPGPEARQISRVRTELELAFDRDSFVTLEAGAMLPDHPEASNPLPGGDYTEIVAPGFVPMAFANPVYVDVNGNGKFDPPGL